ncbi:hypothetical protein FALBO_5602 [Fusarium albosuccineum]|uniref:Ubiquitin-like protease family profile domain-containing protein n=1 Tax=Fusarium albosuccineum TaxID=1237068 RepID=A0A8H4P9N5_9HYPO|nr:hypothetical protein FALBO_5602 [Fusarium albosuccineum]
MENSQIHERPKPTGTAWYYMPGEYMAPLIHGTLIQLGGCQPFTHPDEPRARAAIQDLFPLQPAESVPRLDWSHFGDELRMEGTSLAENWPHRPVLDEADDERRRHLEGIGAAPPAPFENNRQVGLTTWKDHLFDASRLMDQVMGGHRLTGPALMAGLHMATRGLEHAVVLAARPVDVPCGGYYQNPEVGRPGHHGLFRERIILPKVSETALQASSRLGFPTNEALQRAWFGKRFLVIPFNHDGSSCPHWTIGIFDRHLAHILLWDTIYDNHNNYNIRLRKTLRMMQVILSYNSQPFNFAFSAMPISTQLQQWECGLLCLEIVRQTLRGQVGLHYDEICEIMKTEELSGIPVPFCKPELLLCDWLPEPWTWQDDGKAYAAQLRKIRGRWRLWAMEEIGLWDCRVWTSGRRDKVKPVGIRDGTLLPWWLPPHPDADADVNTAPGGLLRARWTQRGGRCYVQHLGDAVVEDWMIRRLREIPESDHDRQELASRGHATYQHAEVGRGCRLPEPLVEVPREVTAEYKTRGWVVDGSRVRRIDEEPDIRILGRAQVLAAAAAGECVSLTSTPAQSPAISHPSKEAPKGNAGDEDTMTDVVSNLSLDDIDKRAGVEDGSEMDGVQPTGPVQRADVNKTGIIGDAIPICALGATQQPLVDMQAQMVIEHWPDDRDGGREMVVDMRRELGLRPAPGASTQFLGSGRGWVTVMPHGTNNEEDMRRMVDVAERGCGG